MVISHENKYVFVEFPRTGSTSISRELVQCYGGKRILRKHSSYNEFLKKATPEERKYFVFSSVRNPMDDAVSHYFKLKTNHREWYTDEEKLRHNNRLAEKLDVLMFRYIQKHDADFEKFFLKFYVFPYNNWASMNRKHYDYVLRFESLDEDFAKAIELLGMELVRPLESRNTTSGRSRNWVSYYTPRIIPRAKKIFGPFMKDWGYEMPEAWGKYEETPANQALYNFLNMFRMVYWKYIRAYI